MLLLPVFRDNFKRDFERTTEPKFGNNPLRTCHNKLEQVVRAYLNKTGVN